VAMRLWHPYPREVVPDLAHDGIGRIAVVPLAQHSAAVYGEAVKNDLATAGIDVAVACAPNWGQRPKLLDAYAAAIHEAMVRAGDGPITVLMTGHSLPKAVIDAGDSYEKEFRASTSAITERLGGRAHVEVAFQSQGFGGGEWLGPDLPTALDRIAARGDKAVVFAPVGFLADHVEILYDLDIEAKELARSRRLASVRAASLNAADALADVVAEVAREVMAA